MAKPTKVTNIQQVQKLTARPGEGATIGYVVRHRPKPDGTTTLTLSLNLGSARVPDRRYTANAASVVQHGDRVTLVFGQTKLGGTGYRSLVLVELSGPAVHQILRTSAAMLESGVKQVERLRLPPAPLTDIREDVPGQTVHFAANIAAAGFTGADACMDYYYASPFSFQVAHSGGEFQAEPVVRVNLPTPLMLSVYDKLAEIKDSLPRDPAESEEEDHG